MDVTLLDLGYMTPVGGRPYFENSFNMSTEELDELCEQCRWLAPEAIRGQEVSPASDVWSLGRMLDVYGL